MTLNVCLAGATGWAGSALARPIAKTADLALLAAVARKHAGQKLTIRHESGNSARPYADGALLAIRKVSTLVGVHRGLDCVLDL